MMVLFDFPRSEGAEVDDEVFRCDEAREVDDVSFPNVFLEVFDNVFWAALSVLRLGDLDLA